MNEQQPQIIMPSEQNGIHNSNLAEVSKRMRKQQTYKDLSTVIVCVTRGGLSLTPRWVTTMCNLIKPMNNRVVGPIYVSGMEVGAAYNAALEMIFSNPQLKDYKYMLTWEDDVLPPPDGLLKMYESIADYDVVGALYWTKGEFGQPMIYGDCSDPQINFRPQIPRQETQHPTYGLGMGFNLFRLDMFKHVEKPWFKTEQSWDPGTGVRAYTQDLYFYERAAKKGFKFCCDTRIRAGHLDTATDTVW